MANKTETLDGGIRLTVAHDWIRIDCAESFRSPCSRCTKRSGLDCFPDGALVTSFPALEKTILKTLSEQEEMHPPKGALAREYFWIAASRLKARGLVDADQIAGVVRRVA